MDMSPMSEVSSVDILGECTCWVDAKNVGLEHHHVPDDHPATCCRVTTSRSRATMSTSFSMGVLQCEQNESAMKSNRYAVAFC